MVMNWWKFNFVMLCFARILNSHLREYFIIEMLVYVLKDAITTKKIILERIPQNSMSVQKQKYRGFCMHKSI